MEFNAQIANWLAAALGGLASWIVIAACTLLVVNILLRIQFLRRRGGGLRWLLDRSLVIRLLSLLFFIWVLLGFSRDEPKLELAPGYGGVQGAAERSLRTSANNVENLSSEWPATGQTNQPLADLREQKKQGSAQKN